MTLEVIAGCMFSGKSGGLIRRVRKLQLQGKKVSSAKPFGDTRWEAEIIGTHDNKESLGARQIVDCDGLLCLISEEKPDAIAIDEVAFLADPNRLSEEVDVNGVNIPEVLRSLSEYRNLQVIVTGLDTYYNRRPFDVVKTLIHHADKVIRLEGAVCSDCTEDAVFTQRFTNCIQTKLGLDGGNRLLVKFKGDKTKYVIEEGDTIFSSKIDKPKKILGKVDRDFSLRFDGVKDNEILLEVRYFDERFNDKNEKRNPLIRNYTIRSGDFYFGGVPSRDGEALLVPGGAGMYEPRCEKCHELPGGFRKEIKEMFLKHEI